MINKHYEAIHKYDFLTKELLQEEYVSNGLTDKKIAEKYNMPSKTVVWKKRKKFGIENKFKNKSNQNAKKNRKYSIEKEEAEQFLKDGMTFREISDKMGCSLMVAKRRFKELGLCREQSQTIPYKYHDVDLTKKQKQMVMGSLLGDGTITESGAYSCSHSIKQKEYFDHKMQVLFNLHSNCFQRYAYLAIDNVNLVNDTESLHFTTGCNKYLYELRNIYYPNGKKIFPYEYLKDNLEAEGLAYWYCDDGGINSRTYSNLFTYGYSVSEQEMMLKLFKDKFGLEARIKIDNSKVRNNCFLSFDRFNTIILIDLVEPYLVPTMRYKIGEEITVSLPKELI